MSPGRPVPGCPEPGQFAVPVVSWTLEWMRTRNAVEIALGRLALERRHEDSTLSDGAYDVAVSKFSTYRPSPPPAAQSIPQRVPLSTQILDPSSNALRQGPYSGTSFVADTSTLQTPGASPDTSPPIHTSPSTRPTATDFLAQIRQRVAEALANAGVPLERNVPTETAESKGPALAKKGMSTNAEESNPFGGVGDSDLATQKNPKQSQSPNPIPERLRRPPLSPQAWSLTPRNSSLFEGATRIYGDFDSWVRQLQLAARSRPAATPDQALPETKSPSEGSEKAPSSPETAPEPPPPTAASPDEAAGVPPTPESTTDRPEHEPGPSEAPFAEP